MSHKKDNDKLRTVRLMDALNWETAKELGLEETGVSLGKTVQEREGNFDEVVDRAEDAVVEEGDRKTRLNLKDEGKEG
ncbi:MAG: small acid-soluble spore protein [Firmicutes bacterium]|nr:small acid-soluble spore protein [Bacillota bacterium]